MRSHHEMCWMPHNVAHCSNQRPALHQPSSASSSTSSSGYESEGVQPRRPLQFCQILQVGKAALSTGRRVPSSQMMASICLMTSADNQHKRPPSLSTGGPWAFCRNPAMHFDRLYLFPNDRNVCERPHNDESLTGSGTSQGTCNVSA